MGFDEWMTPPHVIARARNFFDGNIDLDPASSDIAQQYVQAYEYYTLENSSLNVPWRGNIWLNPPYSRGNVDTFVTKVINEVSQAQQRNDTFNALILVNSQTDTQWYHRLLGQAHMAMLWKGRIKFWKMFDGKAHEKWVSGETGKITNSPRYMSTLFYVTTKDFADGLYLNNFQHAFRGCGTVIERYR